MALEHEDTSFSVVWPAIRVVVTQRLADIGYFALREGNGPQIGRFDLTQEGVQEWLDAGIKAGSVVRTPPAAVGSLNIDGGDTEDDGDLDGFDDDFGDDEEDVDPEDAEDVEDDDDSADEEDLDGDDDGDDDDADGDDDGSMEEEAPPPRYRVADPPGLTDAIDALHVWITMTVQGATPPGATGTFRLHVYLPKGSGIWSKLFSYQRPGAAAPARPAAVQISNPQPPVSPAAPPADVRATLWDELGLNDDEASLAELFMNDDTPPGAPGSPTGSAPGNLDGITRLPAVSDGSGMVAATRAGRRMSPEAVETVPADIRSLFHLHGLYRDHAQHVNDTAKRLTERHAEIDKRYETAIDKLTAAMTQAASIQKSAADELAASLKESRKREDALVEAVQEFRFVEAEQAVEQAQAQDGTRLKAELGKTALGQIGSIVRLGMKASALKKGADPRALMEDFVEEEEAEDDEEYETDEEEYDAEDTDEDEDAEEPSGEAEEWSEEEVLVGQMLNDRPDIVEALAHPDVREYLSDPQHVRELVGLAHMQNEMARLTGKKPPKAKKAPKKVKGGEKPKRTNRAPAAPDTTQENTDRTAAQPEAVNTEAPADGGDTPSDPPTGSAPDHE